MGVMFPLHHKLCSIWLVPVHCSSTYFHFSRPNIAWAKSSEKYPSSQILRGTKQNELWLPTYNFLTRNYSYEHIVHEVFLSSQTYVSGRNDDFYLLLWIWKKLCTWLHESTQFKDGFDPCRHTIACVSERKKSFSICLTNYINWEVRR